MSFEAMASVWRVRLPATIKIALLAYADFAHPKTQECFPSAKSVAEHAHLDRAETWRIRQAMEKHGVIVEAAGKKSVFNVNWAPTDEQLDAFVQDCRRDRGTRARKHFESTVDAAESASEMDVDDPCEALGGPQHNVGSAPTQTVLGRPLQNVGQISGNVGAGQGNVGAAPIEANKPSKEAKEAKRRKSRDGARAPKLPPVYGDLFLAIKTGSRINTQAAANAKRVSDAAKFLCGISDISAARVQEFYAWFSKNDWRGRDKGEIPSPAMLVEEWGKFESGFELPPRQAPPAANRPGRASDAEAEQFRNAMRAAAMGGPQ